MYDFISELLEIASALTAVPMAFMLPPLFHLKACTTSKFDKIVNMVLIFGSIGLALFVTVVGVKDLLEKLEKE